MILNDQYGNGIKTNNKKTVEAINRFTKSFLSYGTDFGIILEAVKEDPECLLAQTQAALYGSFLETNEGLVLARNHISLGRQLLIQGSGSRNEQTYFLAVESALQHDLQKALALHEEIATLWPRNIFASKLAQIHYFNIGDSQGMMRIAKQTIAANKDISYAWGLLAFALEECNELDEAEAVGRKACEMEQFEPWAHHAVAHVYDALGDPDNGIKWMEEHSATWNSCNSFMYTHNWWHVALYYLDTDNESKALSIYDQNLWGAARGDSTYSQDQAGAISILLRLKLRGLNVDERWSQVVAKIAERELWYEQPFLTSHFAYALASSDIEDTCKVFMAEMNDQMESKKLKNPQVWKESAIPLCKGMVAHARQDFSAAASFLGSSRPYWKNVGGSDTQRDLFEQVYIDALIHTSQLTKARELLASRRRKRPNLPIHLSQLKNL